MKYLAGTEGVGIEYSPENEASFRRIFDKVAKDGGQAGLPNTVTFSDADFMGCTVSMKSTSGSIVYYKGTPVVWSSKRQSITATSTCESEY